MIFDLLPLDETVPAVSFNVVEGLTADEVAPVTLSEAASLSSSKSTSLSDSSVVYLLVLVVEVIVGNLDDELFFVTELFSASVEAAACFFVVALAISDF